MLKRFNHLSLISLPVLLVTLAAYIATLMQGTVGGDAGELQYAPPLLALMHSTGLPLYALLGKLWAELVPVGSIAYRMNLLSAVSTALGCAALAWFVWRIYGNRLIGLAAGLTLGFGASIWNQAVLADKYGFNVLMSALIVGGALWWGHLPADESADDASADFRLYVLSFIFGLALLHHRSLALFAVGIGVMVILRLRQQLWRKWRRTLACIALVVIPALVAYPTVLPLMKARELSPLPAQPTTPAEWVDFLLDSQMVVTDALAFDDVTSILGQVEIYITATVRDYTPVVPLIALIGLLVLLRRRPASGLFLLISYVLLAILAANWRGHDRQFTYYPPSFVALVYAYAYGLVFIWERIQPALSGRWRQLAGGAGVLCILALPVIQFAVTYPERWRDMAYGEPLDLWRSTLKTGDMGERLTRRLADLPPDTAIVADWEQVTILWYAQQIDGIRPDVGIYYPIESYTEYTDSPVCLGRHLPVDTARWHPTNVGALICLQDAPSFTLDSRFTPLDIALYTAERDATLALAGYRMDGQAFPQATYVPLEIAWRALADDIGDYSISLQVLDEQWNRIWSQDIQAPVMGMYPTSQWSMDEVVQDYHELHIPPEMPVGRYLWTVVVYRSDGAGGFENLYDAEGNVNILGGVFDVLPRQ